MAPSDSEADRFTLTGDLGAATLAPWISAHARRLGLVARIVHHDADILSVEVAGPPELLDAMEAACLLGPIDVWVESIRRQRLNGPA